MTLDTLSKVADEAIRRSDRAALREAIAKGERLAGSLSAADRVKLEARLLHWRGFEFYFTAYYSRALDLFTQALERYAEADEHSRIARATTNIGACHQFLGDFTKALEMMRRAQAIYRTLNDRIGDATATNNIANLYLMGGDYDAALAAYSESLAAHRELNDLDGIARATGNIGNLYKETGEFEQALKFYEESLRLYDDLKDPAGIGRITGNIGGCYFAMNDYTVAFEYYNRSERIHEDLGDRLRVARMRANIGSIYSNMGVPESALRLSLDALTMHEEIGDRYGIAHLTGIIGDTYADLQQHDLAVEWLERGITLARDLNNRRDLAHFIYSLAAVYLELGRIDEAEALVIQGLAVSDQLPVVRAGLFLCNARIMLSRGKQDLVRPLIEQALEIADQHRLREMQTSAHRYLRDLHRESGPLQTYIYHDDLYEQLSEQTRGDVQHKRMAIASAERRISEERRTAERQRALLYNTLPANIADRLLREEQEVADLHEFCVIMFLDIVAFTETASAMAPNDLIVLLNSVFSICDAVSQRHGLMKVKTIGDSYMAVALPTNDQTPSEMVTSVADAALDLLQEIPHAGAGLNVRIGLHSGPAVAGVIGKDRLQYDLWGDTVNVASRMESSGEPGRIHVSEQIAHHLSSATVRLVPRGRIEIKGKGTMTTYWLESA